LLCPRPCASKKRSDFRVRALVAAVTRAHRGKHATLSTDFAFPRASRPPLPKPVVYRFFFLVPYIRTESMVFVDWFSTTFSFFRSSPFHSSRRLRGRPRRIVVVVHCCWLTFSATLSEAVNRDRGESCVDALFFDTIRPKRTIFTGKPRSVVYESITRGFQENFSKKNVHNRRPVYVQRSY